jgi:hypothetical protein
MGPPGGRRLGNGETTEEMRRVLLYTGPHTTALAWCTPFLKDFVSRRVSPPTARFRSPSSTPFNSD